MECHQNQSNIKGQSEEGTMSQGVEKVARVL